MNRLSDRLNSLSPSATLAMSQKSAELKAAGRRINVWTVNEEEGMRRCIEWGIDGLITNEPVKARLLLEACT